MFTNDIFVFAIINLLSACFPDKPTDAGFETDDVMFMNPVIVAFAEMLTVIFSLVSMPQSVVSFIKKYNSNKYQILNIYQGFLFKKYKLKKNQISIFRLSIIENYTLLSLIFVSLLEKVVVFSYAIFHSFFWLLIRAVRSLSGAEVTPRLRSVSELI